MNQLYYGDNLQVLRDHIAKESVDLIYLDPPFNSKRDYNLLFKTPKGHDSDASITAFEDSWHWGEQAEREFDELLHNPNTDVAEMMKALRQFLGENDMMAYLTMMANRLLELHRVLKPTGSLYLHCDPTASHYLKIVLDGVFGKENFVNEIVWKRYGAHNDVGQGSKHYGRVNDTLFFYSKTGDRKWQQLFMPLDPDYVQNTYRYKDPDGRRFRVTPLTGPGGAEKGNPVFEWNGHTRAWRYSRDTMQKLHNEDRLYYSKTGYVGQKLFLTESRGIPVQTLWDDIASLSGANIERLGFPTQKPLALLERIISASSNEGDVVLDPFCGCGTAVHAAQKLKRKWIGIDITHLAISLIEKRLKDAFKNRVKFDVIGTPGDLDAARDLALRSEHDGRYQFQYWAVSLVNANPAQNKKKGADGGVDGIKFFRDLDNGAHKIVVSVKSGKLKADDVRALNHVREREQAQIALLISLDEPSKGMLADAASAGLYTSVNGKLKVPRVQLLTIEGLLNGTQRAEHPDYEQGMNFKKAKAEATDEQELLI